MKVRLLAYTQNPIDVMWTAARTCYSEKSPIEIWENKWGTIQDNEEYSESSIKEITDKHWKLVKSVLGSGHESIAEHVYFTFAIEGISRSCSHQLVRHRHCTFCVGEDTIIFQRGHGEKRTIKYLYDSKNQYNKERKIRCVNEKTRELLYDSIKEVLYCGKKELYEVETEFGYKIQTTLEHYYLSLDGWKPLLDLKVGDIIFVNGIEAYKDKEWLNKQYNILNKSQQEIANYCGVSPHTIRAWVRRFKLQKPLGTWSIGTEPPNKGRTKNDYEPLKVVSEKMMNNHNFPIYKSMEEHHSYKGDYTNITNSGGYNRTHRQNSKKGICDNCGKPCKTHYHHINHDPRIHDKSNIKELCPTCHKAIHAKEVKKVIIPNKIISIKYIGLKDTYDISMAGEHHNYIANGFVVHNSQQSQRYVEIKENLSNILRWEEAKPLLDKYFIDVNTSNWQEYLYCLQHYLHHIQMGIKPEDARMILPNATKTNITMSINLRELMHICNLRLCSRASAEIRNLFLMIKEEVMKADSRLGVLLVPNCEKLGYCPESKCCGRAKTFKQLFDDNISKEDLQMIKDRTENPQKNENLEKLMNMKSVFEEKNDKA